MRIYHNHRLADVFLFVLQYPGFSHLFLEVSNFSSNGELMGSKKSEKRAIRFAGDFHLPWFEGLQCQRRKLSLQD
jgi:hypothetical protein